MTLTKMNPFLDRSSKNVSSTIAITRTPRTPRTPRMTRTPTTTTTTTTPPKPPKPTDDILITNSRSKNARSLSRINDMTVGDVRQCFSQMRNTPSLKSNTTLWCGISAGNFALRYLVNTAGSSRRKTSCTTSVTDDPAGL